MSLFPKVVWVETLHRALPFWIKGMCLLRLRGSLVHAFEETLKRIFKKSLCFFG